MNPVFPFPAVIAIKIRKIIDRFKQNGAVTPDHAVYPDSIGISDNLLFRKLTRQGVIVETSPGKFYLNEENLSIYNRNRRTRAAVVMLVIIIAFILYFILHPNP
jgi:hypothetical protein